MSETGEKGRITIIRQNWAIIISLATFFIYAIRKYDLTFDDQAQKQRILERYDRPVMTEEEKDALQRLVEDPNRHTSFEDKTKQIRMESKQEEILGTLTKVGQDLQEIKNLVRKNN